MSWLSLKVLIAARLYITLTVRLWFSQKLEANEEDSYLNAQWADPQELKRSFQGLRDIKWGGSLK